MPAGYSGPATLIPHVQIVIPWVAPPPGSEGTRAGDRSDR